MKVAIAGAKAAVLDELDSLVHISDETREALEKLTIRELLRLIKDVGAKAPQ
jgi:hypothetical protein